MPNDTTHTPTGIEKQDIVCAYEQAQKYCKQNPEADFVERFCEDVFGQIALSRRPSGEGSFFRGHGIVEKDGEWFYADNGDSVKDTWRDRPCGVCGLPNTPEGHDGCIGTIPGAINACCGHGFPDEAYVQSPSGDEGDWLRELENALLDASRPATDYNSRARVLTFNEARVILRRALSAPNSKGGGE